jgi:hypothetical protein
MSFSSTLNVFTARAGVPGGQFHYISATQCRTPENLLGCLGLDKFVNLEVNVCAKSGQFGAKIPGCMCHNLDNLGVDAEACVTVWTIVVKVSQRTISSQDPLVGYGVECLICRLRVQLLASTGFTHPMTQVSIFAF